MAEWEGERIGTVTCILYDVERNWNSRMGMLAEVNVLTV